MDIQILPEKCLLGRQAAAWCAKYLDKIINKNGKARIILATGASQFDFLDHFVKFDLPWGKIECFHLDEYVGLPMDHPASFRKYLTDRVFTKVSEPFGKVHLLNPDAIDSYAHALNEAPIDLACIGIGENGHIAFNDPPDADFNDTKMVKIVELDEACRMQQVGEGWFSSLKNTPTHAATLTIPAIMKANCISCVVPEARKAEAVYNAVKGELSTSCPASILRRHKNTTLWLDKESSALVK